LVAHARVGGMLGGKAGIVNIHMGDAKNPFDPLYSLVESSELSFRQLFPTHVNRNHYIFEDAKSYGKLGVVDITTSSYPYFPDEEIKPSEAVRLLLEAEVPEEHITMTSDAFGSLPLFDAEGNLLRLEMGLLSSLFNEMRDIVQREKLGLTTALRTVTANPARVLKLGNKGRIAVGADADICLIDSQLNLRSVIAMGQWMMRDGKMLKKGTYE
ncbi:MAG TPA: amidohydrolase family protein, partial [Bacteroidales bacterium]|nr:amidohydrolase family protein [Bacteroidales bacterium]